MTLHAAGGELYTHIFCFHPELCFLSDKSQQNDRMLEGVKFACREQGMTLIEGVEVTENYR